MYDWIDELGAIIGDFEGDPFEVWTFALHNGQAIIEGKMSAKTKVAADKALYTELVDFLDSLADDLAIPSPKRDVTQDPNLELEKLFRFSRKVRADSVRAKLKAKTIGDPNLKPISATVQKQILSLTSDLRAQIEELEISEVRKARLTVKLTAFETEVRNPSSRVGSLLPALSIVGATLVGGVTTLADGPAALETLGKLSALISYDQAQEEEILAIEKETDPLLLPSPEEQEVSQ